MFELRDLWPESIPAVGAMRASFALRLLERLELRMYRNASAIVCVTESFVRSLTARGIDAAKLHFVPNGIVPAFWHAARRADERRELGLDDSDVLASYVGTFGMAHGLSTVLAAAARLQTAAPAVKLLIVGDGAELEALRTAAAARRPAQRAVHGLVPREKVPGILAATDIALVTLKPCDVFKTVLPSKMFEAMAARCAIVLGVDGEARATLERAGAGLAVLSRRRRRADHAIAELAADPDGRARMARAGGDFVDREFSRKTWADAYIGVLAGWRNAAAPLGCNSERERGAPLVADGPHTPECFVRIPVQRDPGRLLVFRERAVKATDTVLELGAGAGQMTPTRLTGTRASPRRRRSRSEGRTNPSLDAGIRAAHRQPSVFAVSRLTSCSRFMSWSTSRGRAIRKSPACRGPVASACC